jgi:hypothetical protein
MDEVKIGIKETLEILDGLELLGVAGVKISKDGLAMDDIVHLVSVAKEFEVLSDAVEGGDDALKELKDLDQDEAISLLVRLFALVKALKSAKA